MFIRTKKAMLLVEAQKKQSDKDTRAMMSIIYPSQNTINVLPNSKLMAIIKRFDPQTTLNPAMYASSTLKKRAYELIHFY